MSQRNKTPHSTASGDRRASNAIPERQILDAAYALLLGVGMRRMTMADIARQAEVSRATLYRRWSNVGEVVGTLMTREWAVVAESAFDGAAPTARAQLVDGVVRVVAEIRMHPLLRKIIDLDPEFLLPYLLKRRGTSTDEQLGLIEHVVRAGMEDSSIRAGDAPAFARSVLLSAWSFALTGPVVLDGDDLSGLDDQLRDLLDRYLAP